MGWGVYVARMAKKINSCSDYVSKPEGKRRFGRHKTYLGDIIKTYLIEIRSKAVGWIHLGQDRAQWQLLVYSLRNLQVPQNPGNFLSC
jgi:hypothetical protein